MAEENRVHQITQLILQWKLHEARALLEKVDDELSVKDIFALRTLLADYSDAERLMNSAKEKEADDPEIAQYFLFQIDESIRTTHPEYDVLQEKVNARVQESKIVQAEQAIDSARDALVIALDQAKADDLIEQARMIFPAWEKIPVLREKMLSAIEFLDKFGRGLSIQTEISDLREKGGYPAYKKALALLNQYRALGLEEQGIVLFDVESERESLLKMMTRASGESWSARLSPADREREMLKLEQSIRSLEDAENKNLRVLFNNNGRLIELLLTLIKELPEEDEQSIQAHSRIDHLRRKNMEYETQIRKETALRAESYCTIAERALETGELSAAEIQLQLAQNAGTVPHELSPFEILGDIELPTEMLAKIQLIAASLQTALSVRAKVIEKYHQLRISMNDSDAWSVTQWETLSNEAEELMAQDPHTPGLRELTETIRSRYESARVFIFDQGLEEIDALIQVHSFAQAKEKIKSLSLLSKHPEEKRKIKAKQTKLGKREEDCHVGESLLHEVSQRYAAIIASMKVESEDSEWFDNLAAQLQPMAEKTISATQWSLFMRQRQAVARVKQHQKSLSLIQNKLNQKVVSEETAMLAAQIAADDDGLVPEISELTAQYQNFVARQTETTEQVQRIQKHVAVLEKFNVENAVTEGMDYLTKHITAEDKKDFQLAYLTDQIEQAFRRQQADFYYQTAVAAAERGELGEAEEAIDHALEQFYSIEAAQFQKQLANRIMTEREALQALQQFLEKEGLLSEPLSEEASNEIHFIVQKIALLEKNEFHEKAVFDAMRTAKMRIEKRRRKETTDLAQAKIAIEHQLLSDAEGLKQAKADVSALENRVWIEPVHEPILQLRLWVDSLVNVYQELTILIQRGEKYIRQGDFLAAERVLNAFQWQGERALPEWISIQKENALARFQLLAQKYQAVNDKINMSGSDDTLMMGVSRALDPTQPDLSLIYHLLNELGLCKTILEREIQMTADQSELLRHVNYLLELLHWVESSNDAFYGTGARPVNLSLDAIYAIRKNGKSLFERIPAGLSAIQPAFSARNKWLEQRTMVKQQLIQIQQNRKKKAILRESFNALSHAALLPHEQKELDDLQAEIDRRKRRLGCLGAVLILIPLLLGALYFSAPKWIPLLTPTATITPTLTASAAPTYTATATSTETPFFTQTPTATSTNTPLPSITPTPANLQGAVIYKRVGVYELPDGNRTMLSKGYLPIGTELTILRYCNPNYEKNTYWALIEFEESGRKMGWVPAVFPNVKDYLSVTGQGVETLSAWFDAKPAMKIPCPISSDDPLPGIP